MESGKTFRLTRAPFGVPGLPDGLRGLKILHLSDLHGMRFGERNKALAASILAESPDLILATGDMCDDRGEDGRGAFPELLEGLGGQIPVCASVGNHEKYLLKSRPEDYADYHRALKARGAAVLDNSSVYLRLRGTGICLYGFSRTNGPASLKTVRALLGDCPRNAPVFVLSHHPKWFDALEEWGACAVFSGHLHGGLIRLPLLGGVLSPSLTLFPRYDKGIFRLPRAAMHLSAGFGDSSLRLRLCNPREANLLILEPASGRRQRASESERVLRAALAGICALSAAAGLRLLFTRTFPYGGLAAALAFGGLTLLLLRPFALARRRGSRRGRALRRWGTRLLCLGAAAGSVLWLIFSGA